MPASCVICGVVDRSIYGTLKCYEGDKYCSTCLIEALIKAVERLNSMYITVSAEVRYDVRQT